MVRINRVIVYSSCQTGLGVVPGAPCLFRILLATDGNGTPDGTENGTGLKMPTLCVTKCTHVRGIVIAAHEGRELCNLW